MAGVRTARFSQLVSIIGTRLAAKVVLELRGRRITIGKKVRDVRGEYLADPGRYDALGPSSAAGSLGCTVRYYKKLRSERRGDG